MTLEEVEQAIYDYYQWFHREAPDVTPSEFGQLAHLWASFDYLFQREHPAYGN